MHTWEGARVNSGSGTAAAAGHPCCQAAIAAPASSFSVSVDHPGPKGGAPSDYGVLLEALMPPSRPERLAASLRPARR